MKKRERSKRDDSEYVPISKLETKIQEIDRLIKRLRVERSKRKGLIQENVKE